jgi:hypothetical protein
MIPRSLPDFRQAAVSRRSCSPAEGRKLERDGELKTPELEFGNIWGAGGVDLIRETSVLSRKKPGGKTLPKTLVC